MAPFRLLKLRPCAKACPAALLLALLGCGARAAAARRHDLLDQWHNAFSVAWTAWTEKLMQPALQRCTKHYKTRKKTQHINRHHWFVVTETVPSNAKPRLGTVCHGPSLWYGTTCRTGRFRQDFRDFQFAKSAEAQSLHLA